MRIHIAVVQAQPEGSPPCCTEAVAVGWETPVGYGNSPQHEKMYRKHALENDRLVNHRQVNLIRCNQEEAKLTKWLAFERNKWEIGLTHIFVRIARLLES